MKRKRYPQIRFKGFNNDWEQRKLTEFVEFFNGQTYSPSNVQENGTLVLRSSNVQNGEITKDDSVYIDNKVVNTDNVKIGDIIVVVRNGSRNLIGKHAQIKLNMPNTVIGAFMTGIRTKNSNFVNSLLNTPIFEEEISKNMGATINQITGYMFSNMEFKIPSDKEQEQIGKLFNELDNLITLHQNKHDKLVEIKKSLLEKMFPKNNEKIPEIRFKGFTDNWKQHKLDELGIIQTGNTPSTVKKEYYSNTGIQWVTPTDITDNVIRTTERKLSRIGAKVGRIVPPNTILVTCIASIGKNAIVTEKSAFNQQINSLTPYFEKHNPYFLLADSINWSNTMKKEAGGLTFQIVNKSQFSKIETKVPKEKQEEEKIGVLFKTIDKLVTLYQHNLINLINLKKTLLRKMFI